MEEMEGHKTDMSLLKDDTINELQKDSEEVFAKGRQAGLDVGDELTERLGWVFAEMCDRIEKVKRVRLRKMVAVEVSRCKRRRKGVPHGVGKRLTRGGQKLLGRRREPDELEWVDC